MLVSQASGEIAQLNRLLQHIRSSLVKGTARFRELWSIAVPGEELNPQFVLEVLHHLADRRLRLVQPFGGAAKGAGADDRVKHPQLLKRHRTAKHDEQ